MSNTPRTDAVIHADHSCYANEIDALRILARQLERELADAKRQNDDHAVYIAGVERELAERDKQIAELNAQVSETDSIQRAYTAVRRSFDNERAEYTQRIADIEARLVVSEQDARRYRWVRSQSVSFEDEWTEHNGNVIRIVRSEEYLDKHVDEMLAQEEEEE